MKLLKTLGILLFLAVFCALVVTTAMADDFNRKTKLTFSGARRSSGRGRPDLAGWHLCLQDSGFHVRPAHCPDLQQDESHLYTTILAIPNYRLKTTDKTVITFANAPPDSLRP